MFSYSLEFNSYKNQLIILQNLVLKLEELKHLIRMFVVIVGWKVFTVLTYFLDNSDYTDTLVNIHSCGYTIPRDY